MAVGHQYEVCPWGLVEVQSALGVFGPLSVAQEVTGVKVEDIEIVVDGDLHRPYNVLGPIEARVTAGAAWNRARTVEDVNWKLREVALKHGANAVINVTYKRGVSATSWKALTAYGTAVVAVSMERKCPYCAEMIKREARVCRFCGRDVEPTAHVGAENDVDLTEVQQRHPNTFDTALPYLRALTQEPTYPGAWLLELCRRIEAGSPPEAASARIPLDWMRPEQRTSPPSPVLSVHQPDEAGEYPALAFEFPTLYDTARSAMAGLGERPENPEGWLRELCRRIEAGSPPEAAAVRIPLDWSS